MVRIGRLGMALLVAAGALTLGVAAWPQNTPPVPATVAVEPTLKIGYLEIADDPKYDRAYVYARIPAVPNYRPRAGAELGVADSNANGRFTHLHYELVVRAGADAKDLIAWVQQQRKDNDVRFFLLDVPTEVTKALIAAIKDPTVLFVNVADPDDSLRGASCARNLAHTAASYNMLADGVMQYLAGMNWTRILLLQGPLPEDAKFAAAVQRSAKRMGGTIVDKKPFVLSNDPRAREANNVALMTATSRDYDVTWIVDEDGEFGRYVPYGTQKPRPVVGTTGLVASPWSWAWERQGAPQLSSRFDRAAGRFMYGPDWSAWSAIRSIVQAAERAKTFDFQPVRDYLLSDQLRFDGYHGSQLNFRPWDNQLRMNLYVETYNAVLARMPSSKFQHATNELDTLGVDKPETTCKF